MPVILGAHFSVAGGLEKALYTARDLNCQAAQIFTKNARSWKEPVLSQDQIRQFIAARQETKVVFVASHCTYLINVAAADEEKRHKSLESLAAEMERSALLGLDAVVLHPGAHLGAGIEAGLDAACQSLSQVLSRYRGDVPKLLLETTAGTGSSLGSRFEELGHLIRLLVRRLGDDVNVGVCLDTSHIFGAGYDIRTDLALEKTLEAFDKEIGISRLALVHLNDSKPALGSRKDRHEHIGLGKIGMTGFRAVMTSPALANIPKVLETPKERDGLAMDPVNLDLLRELALRN